MNTTITAQDRPTNIPATCTADAGTGLTADRAAPPEAGLISTSGAGPTAGLTATSRAGLAAAPTSAPAVASATGPGPATPTASASAARPVGRRDRRGPGSPRPLPPRPSSRPGPGSGPLRRPLPPHVLFAQRLLAVLSGERPVHWMLGQTVGEAYEQLVQLAPSAPFRDRGVRPVVHRCGGFPPRPGVVEAYATIATGGRLRAMAYRLELGTDRRWRCAVVELDGDRAGV